MQSQFENNELQSHLTKKLFFTHTSILIIVQKSDQKVTLQPRYGLCKL